MAVYYEDNNGEKHLIRYITVHQHTYRLLEEPNGNVIIKEDVNQNQRTT